MNAPGVMSVTGATPFSQLSIVGYVGYLSEVFAPLDVTPIFLMRESDARYVTLVIPDRVTEVGVSGSTQRLLKESYRENFNSDEATWLDEPIEAKPHHRLVSLGGPQVLYFAEDDLSQLLSIAESAISDFVRAYSVGDYPLAEQCLLRAGRALPRNPGIELLLLTIHRAWSKRRVSSMLAHELRCGFTRSQCIAALSSEPFAELPDPLRQDAIQVCDEVHR